MEDPHHHVSLPGLELAISTWFLKSPSKQTVSQLNINPETKKHFFFNPESKENQNKGRSNINQVLFDADLAPFKTRNMPGWENAAATSSCQASFPWKL